MAVTQSTHSYAYDESVGEVAFQEYYDTTRQAIGLYDIRKSVKARENVASFGGVGLLEKKSQGANYAELSPAQQRKKTFTHDAYAGLIDIEREAADDDPIGMIEEFGIELGGAGAHTEEYWCADLFNDLFDGARHTAEDAKSIVNDAHTNVDGGNSIDNKTTNTLTYPNLKSARQAMREFTDYTGERKLMMTPDELMAGLQLEEDVWQLVRTMGKPGTADNDRNMFMGMKGYILQWLDWTTQWALMDAKLRKKFLRFYSRVGLEILSDRTFSAGTRKIGAYERFSLGCTDFRWVYGGTGGA